MYSKFEKVPFYYHNFTTVYYEINVYVTNLEIRNFLIDATMIKL